MAAWLRVLLLALCAVSALDRTASAQPGAHVRLQFDGPSHVPSPVLARAVDEAARIWAPHDVQILSDAGGCDDGPTLQVMFDVDHELAPHGSGLGELHFNPDGLPDPIVTIYYRTIQMLADTVEVAGTAASLWPPRIRTEIVGRSVGRALAHEIGHFVLRWPHHADGGLMQAEHRASSLADPDLAAFALTGNDLARLLIVRTAAPSFTLPNPRRPRPILAARAAGCAQPLSTSR